MENVIELRCCSTCPRIQHSCRHLTPMWPLTPRGSSPSFRDLFSHTLSSHTHSQNTTHISAAVKKRRRKTGHPLCSESGSACCRYKPYFMFVQFIISSSRNKVTIIPVFSVVTADDVTQTLTCQIWANIVSDFCDLRRWRRLSLRKTSVSVNKPDASGSHL